MNDHDCDKIAAMMAAKVERRRAIPVTAFIRVCERIEPERELARGPRLEQPLAERWKVLTRLLKLAGAPAMHQSGTGRYQVLDALAKAIPWAAPLIEEIARQLRIQLALGRPWIRIEPLLLVGAPGIGETWLARRLARALGVEFAGLELGNASDDRTLSGTARGWSSAQPAWPLVVMASGRTANPMPPPDPEHFDAIMSSVAADLAVGWDVPRASLPELPQRARLLLRERFARNPSVRALARDTRALVGAMLADSGGPRRH